MNGGVPVLVAALLLTACGGLARDPDGADPGNLPPPFSGPVPPAAGAPVATGTAPPTFGAGTIDIEQAPATVVRCDGPNTTDFGAMHLSTEWDHIILISVNTRRGADGITGSFEAMEGVPCDRALDPVPCQSAYAAARPEPGGEWTECGVQCRSLGIAVTHGDQVFFYDSYAELLGLLGSIDSEHEAALWARINGYRALCDRTVFARQNSGSYLLAVGDPPRNCGEETSTLYLRILPDGTIIEQRRDENTTTPGCFDTIR